MGRFANMFQNPVVLLIYWLIGVNRGLHFPCYVLFPFCSSLRLRCDINLKRVGSQEVPTHMASGTDSDEQFFYQWVFYEASVQSSDGSTNRNRG